MKLQRCRQFFTALQAHISPEDICFIKNFLLKPEQELFFAMNPSDQYHALRTAFTARKLLAAMPDGSGDEHFLTRCALLHDIGRRKGDMGILGKVFAVLMQGCFGQRSFSWARYGKSPFWQYPRHILYVYYHHPRLGADALSALGMKREADVIAAHHTPAQPGDSLELKLLRQADAMN